MAGLCALALSLGSASAQTLASSTIGGSAGVTGSSNTGLGTFFQPFGVVVDSLGNAYIADTNNHLIRKISSAGVVSTLVGAVNSPSSTDDSNANAPAARFSTPRGIALNSAGDRIYVTDAGTGAIRMISLSAAGGTVTGVSTLVAAGTFSFPAGIVADGSANLYVADYGNNVIRKIVTSPSVVVTVLAGLSGTGGFADGNAASARFLGPTGVALNSAGDTLFVADRDNNLIRRITGLSATVAVSNYAGTQGAGGAPGTAGFADNATGTSATFRTPTGVAVDSSGNVYVADFGNNAIRVISSSGTNAVSTPLGAPATGSLAGASGSTDGIGNASRFTQPAGVAARTISSVAYLYVTDLGNSLVRRAAAPSAPTVGSPTPSTQTVSAGANGVVFSAAVTGFPSPTLQWERNPGGNTTFQSLSNGATYSGVNTPSLTINGVTAGMNNDTFRLTATNSQGGPVSSAFPAQLIVNQAPQFSAGSVTFTAQVGVPISNAVVTAAGSPTPTYSAPSGAFGFGFQLLSNGTITGTPTSTTDAVSNVTVTATNTGGTATQQVTINVLPAASTPVITSQPVDYTVPQGQTFANPAFTVAATANPGITGYQWQKRSSDGFTWLDLSNDGIYSNVTSPALSINGVSPAMNGEVFRVRVFNLQGVTESNTVILYVGQPPTITHASSYTFVVGQYSEFPLTATGVPAPTFNVFGQLPDGIQYDSIGKKLYGSAQHANVTTFNLSIQATNNAGTSNVQNFTLYVSTVGAAAAISQQPGNATASQVGSTVTFVAAATGSPVPSVRWQRQPTGTSNFVDIFNDGTYSGTDTGTIVGNTITSTLTITNVAPGMTGDQFRLVATNTVSGSATSATSSAASLLVNAGTSISTFAGLAQFSGSTDATGTNARFNTPAGITTDIFGNFYVADQANHVIRKITPGGVVSTLAGQAGVAGNTDGVGTAARFNSPAAVASDSIGNVYVADTFNHTIRLINTSGAVTTVAGLAGNIGNVDGIGSAARFNSPAGLAIVGGSIYIADTSNHTIRRMLGSTVTTYAGTAGVSGSLNGNGANARFNYPNGIAGDNSGNLYVADSFNHVIRRISGFGDVSVFAGLAGTAGSADGNGSLARFNQPVGVASDSSGNIYVADTFSHTIRKITPGADVTTLAGAAGVTGSNDGVGAAARFSGPLAVTVDVSGNVYIADTRNHTIRRTGSTSSPGITTQPQNRAAAIGGSTTFSVVATGVPSPSYQWQRQAANTFGFFNLSNTGSYQGVNTATLTVSNILSSEAGDQFRVVLSNGFGVVTSDVATLTLGDPPVFTSGTGTSFRATEAGTFNVTVTSNPSPSFTLTDAPSWLSINQLTGQLTGTPPADAVGTHTFTINATNGVLTTQTFTLTVTPAIQPPSISSQPANASINVGQSATFSVSVTGTEPFTYQWRRNGVAIPGATASTLTLANVQLSAAGTYTVSITNAATTVHSNGAELVVNSAPVITQQPRSEIAQAGSVVTFSVSAVGGSSFNFQWRKNGVAIVGATNSSLTLSGVTAADQGNYDVQVGNGLGVVTSSTAQLTISTGSVAPVITAQPVSRTVVAGGSVTLSVAATGVPAVSYQWRKNGQQVPGATGRSFVFNPAQASDAGNYDVVISNGVGAVTSSTAGLRVISRSYAGYYFGAFGTNGNFALFVREDNTAVFLGYLPGANAPVMSLNVTINDDGSFAFSQAAISGGGETGEPARAAALGATSVSGSINGDGLITGTLSGGAQTSLSATRSADSGPTSSYAGYYTSSAATGGASSYVIAGPGSQAFAVTVSGNVSDGGLGSVGSNGTVSVTTSRASVTQTIGSNGTISGSASGVISAQLAGGSEAVVARQRLVNISSRARVGGADAVGIAGFVISGEESKTVLIRVVGPTLASSFNLAGALTAPKLEVFRGQTLLMTNQGIAANRAGIDAAGALVGAFTLAPGGADAAVVTTLAPGAYTAVASSANETPGVALIEVYDLSGATPGQKLLNISTRAAAGANENTLIAGFVVPAGASKRVLIRGIGPGLAAFGLTGTLPSPTLALLNGSGATVAQTTGVGNDGVAIALASAQVGAFGLASGDSAMIATLAPGNYTAQVTGAGGATGIALIEVYELP